MAGCAGPAGPTLEGSPAAPAPPAEPAPTANELMAAAVEEAKKWDPASHLVMVATFEGEVPSYRLLLDTDNRWTAPYLGSNDPIGDGRAAMWSFSFAAPGPDDTMAETACDQGIHAEIREVHVVTLDANGTVAAYETRNDDEGAIPRGQLPTEWMDSADAARIAARETAMEEWAADATWSRVYLNAGWNWPQAAWTFSFDSEDERHVVTVDASTGEILADDQIPSPPC